LRPVYSNPDDNSKRENAAAEIVELWRKSGADRNKEKLDLYNIAFSLVKRLPVRLKRLKEEQALSGQSTTDVLPLPNLRKDTGL